MSSTEGIPILLSLLGLLSGLSIPSELQYAETSLDDPIVKVFVVYRPLESLSTIFPILAAILSHSGLLLRTDTGGHYLLEYANDGKAHLKEVEYTINEKTTEGCRRLGYESIKMCGYSWEKQLEGRRPPPGKTPNIAKREMQKLMPFGFDITEGEMRHTAQRRLRDAWGILKDD
ncbi:hypothetical protein EC973_001452 [Apophysomyces ossiformis]|uniref:Uncharacterized protein n=1 Tax=Apophysomyces ossiformis TaxID=679940 RepID=A0A8H7BJQ3_9FUNG|nr:hypothetical protein EC973_001452 [Apophysomyces ossiformis]